MKFPSLIVAAALIAVVTFLQYLSGHVEAFGLPLLYAPLITLAISTLIKLIQERIPPAPTATARGFDGDQPRDSFVARVLYK